MKFFNYYLVTSECYYHLENLSFKKVSKSKCFILDTGRTLPAVFSHALDEFFILTTFIDHCKYLKFTLVGETTAIGFVSQG